MPSEYIAKTIADKPTQKGRLGTVDSLIQHIPLDNGEKIMLTVKSVFHDPTQSKVRKIRGEIKTISVNDSFEIINLELGGQIEITATGPVLNPDYTHRISFERL